MASKDKVTESTTVHEGMNPGAVDEIAARARAILAADCAKAKSSKSVEWSRIPESWETKIMDEDITLIRDWAMETSPGVELTIPAGTPIAPRKQHKTLPVLLCTLGSKAAARALGTSHHITFVVPRMIIGGIAAATSTGGSRRAPAVVDLEWKSLADAAVLACRNMPPVNKDDKKIHLADGRMFIQKDAPAADWIEVVGAITLENMMRFAQNAYEYRGRQLARARDMQAAGNDAGAWAALASYYRPNNFERLRMSAAQGQGLLP